MLKQGIYEHIINQETDRKMQEAERSGFPLKFRASFSRFNLLLKSRFPNPSLKF